MQYYKQNNYRTSIVAFQQLIETSGIIAKTREFFSEAIQKEFAVILKETLQDKSGVHKKSLEYFAKYSDDLIQLYEEFEKVLTNSHIPKYQNRNNYEKQAKESDLMLKKYEETVASPNAGCKFLSHQKLTQGNKLKNVVNTAEDRIDGV